MKLLRLTEAAEVLGTRPEHVRRLTRERGLPFVRVGRLTRIDADDLDAWIAANRHGYSS
jgi:excisionase family DNA binding protein